MVLSLDAIWLCNDLPRMIALLILGFVRYLDTEGKWFDQKGASSSTFDFQMVLTNPSFFDKMSAEFLPGIRTDPGKLGILARW